MKLQIKLIKLCFVDIYIYKKGKISSLDTDLFIDFITEYRRNL